MRIKINFGTGNPTFEVDTPHVPRVGDIVMMESYEATVKSVTYNFNINIIYVVAW